MICSVTYVYRLSETTERYSCVTPIQVLLINIKLEKVCIKLDMEAFYLIFRFIYTYISSEADKLYMFVSPIQVLLINIKMKKIINDQEESFLTVYRETFENVTKEVLTS